MKRFFFILAIVAFLCVIFTGTDFKTKREEIIKIAPKGCGYTVIEAGRAIDCKGDTIMINKIHPEIAALR